MLPISVKKELSGPEQTTFEQFSLSIFQKTNIPKKEAQLLVNKIVKHYSEPHRAYHNLSHLQSLFKVMELSEKRINHPVIFQLAILFHDIIYEIGPKDNEVKSAALAAELIGRSLKKEELNILVKMIESTAKHEPLSNEEDIRLFLDCDLSILAAPPTVYQKYAKAIRLEYIKFPTLLYRHGRKKVLRQFLQKERIYFTEFFYKNHEGQAKENLRSELQSLKSLFS